MIYTSKNWLLYNVLLQGEFRSGDIVVRLSNKKPLQNEITNKSVEQLWTDMVKGRKSVGKKTWDSPVFSLLKYAQNNNKLYLDVGETSFKYLQGTNATYWLLGDIFGKEYLANGLLVQTMVFDKDGKCVFGKRSSGVKKEYQPIVIFGGTMDKTNETGKEIKNGNNPFVAIKIELEEELGVTPAEIEDIYIKYLVEDRKYYPIFYFYTILNIGFNDLCAKFEKSGDKDEHSELILLSKSQMRNLLNKTPEKSSDLTLTALDLYLKEN